LEKQKAAAKKKAKKCDDDDDNDDEDEDEYTALSKSPKKNNLGGAKPPIGSLDKCAKCSKQFAVVRFFGCYVVCIILMSAEDEVHDGRRPSTWLSLPPLC
jgi:hypothetical protein